MYESYLFSNEYKSKAKILITIQDSNRLIRVDVRHDSWVVERSTTISEMQKNKQIGMQRLDHLLLSAPKKL